MCAAIFVCYSKCSDLLFASVQQTFTVNSHPWFNREKGVNAQSNGRSVRWSEAGSQLDMAGF